MRLSVLILVLSAVIAVNCKLYFEEKFLDGKYQGNSGCDVVED